MSMVAARMVRKTVILAMAMLTTKMLMLAVATMIFSKNRAFDITSHR